MFSIHLIMRTEHIYKEFGNELLTFIQSRVNNVKDAEDLFHDTFIRIHQKINTLKDETKLQSWLYQISRNVIIDSYRKKKPELASSEDLAYIPMESDTYHHDITNCIKPFIKELPEKYSDVLNQTIYGGISQKDYAKKMGLSYTATKSRVQRARKQLKEIFSCCCIEAGQNGTSDFSDMNKNCEC